MIPKELEERIILYVTCLRLVEELLKKLGVEYKSEVMANIALLLWKDTAPIEEVKECEDETGAYT